MASNCKCGKCGIRENKRDCAQPITDEVANELLQMWSEHFPGVVALTMPSTANGVFTLAYGMDGPNMRLNGLISKSPLANFGLFSTEVSNGKYIPSGWGLPHVLMAARAKLVLICMK